MRVLVCGSRGWTDWTKIKTKLAALPGDAVIVHGGARGADSMAGYVAKQLGLVVEVHKPDWDKHGRSAGYKRNIQMLDSGVDLVIAFWDGRSKGTRHTIVNAQQRGVKVDVG